MATGTPLTAWALANAGRLDLDVVRVTWPEEWLPGYFDYRVSIPLRGIRHVGQGMDRNESAAFTKAVAEAMERAAVSDLVEPWATAAHLDMEQASHHAYLELLGIDRALCHHFCGIYLRPVPLESIVARNTLSALSGMLRKHSLSLHVREMRPTRDARACVAFCWSEDSHSAVPGFVAGFGSGASTETASLHALLECLRSATAIFAGGIHQEEDLAALAARSDPRWHFWMAKTAESLDYVRQTLLASPPGNRGSWEHEDVSISNVRFRRIESLDAILPDLPLVVVQAQSEQFMRPQFGSAPLDEPSLRRLERFNGRPLGTLAPVPHFYG
ncbi:MAG: hypothetical protein A2X37_06190 [Elusimicrobia bacterium GWA2_66_18]|nr:MAG: hypothetical protein A2X37_06190 [Elusimicrobia bacterium GWA2_66_18]